MHFCIISINLPTYLICCVIHHRLSLVKVQDSFTVEESLMVCRCGKVTYIGTATAIRSSDDDPIITGFLMCQGYSQLMTWPILGDSMRTSSQEYSTEASDLMLSSRRCKNQFQIWFSFATWAGRCKQRGIFWTC